LSNEHGPTATPEQAREFAMRFDELVENIETFIRGKSTAVRHALVCLFAEGHLLLEDVPGVAKTSLARAIAQSITATVQRIQFTPDLLPSDITGVRIWNTRTQEFRFEEGPVFANIVIADEINRASPKTQSAMLEVMAERQVTVAGAAQPVPHPFLCVATQNPFDHRGTYALPEAQLDRFTMRIGIGYPALDDEIDIIGAGRRREVPGALRSVTSLDEMKGLFDVVRTIDQKYEVTRYIAQLVQATRSSPDLSLGASPRGAIALAVCAQALAAADGRHYTKIADVKNLAVPVLAHRLVLSPSAVTAGRSTEEVLRSILRVLPTPGESTRRR
jgi:MoxR-like ATPase